MTSKPPLARTLAATVAIQACASVAVFALPTIAPIAALQIGVPPWLIGFQTSLVYLAATLMSVFAGTVLARSGPVRTSQYALAAVAVGVAALASGSFPIVLLASATIGIGYAMTNPAGAEMLARSGAGRHRNLVFSIKQTAVPLGGIVAGLLLPLLATAFGWKIALMLSAVASAGLALLLQPLRPNWDFDRTLGPRPATPPLVAFRRVLESRPLRILAMTGFLFSTIQLALGSYAVVMLVSEFEWSLLAAGSGAAAIQLGGVAGRILWGVLADRSAAGFSVLAVIGSATAAITWLLPLARNAPTAALVGLLVALGVTAVGWNGVLLADTTRHVEPAEAGGVTAIVLMFTFSGVILGPLSLAALAILTGSYVSAFAILAAAPLAAAALLFFNRSA